MGNITSKDESDMKNLRTSNRRKYKNNSNANIDQMTATTQKNEKKIKRSASGADVTEKYTTQLMPIEKLCAILKEKSSAQGVNGVTADAFVSQIFRPYPDLGQRLFKFLHINSKATTQHLGCVAFRQQCERFLSIMDDVKIMECYIKMYAENENSDVIDKEGVTRLLHMCYTIAMQQCGNTIICPKIKRTFASVTNSIFFSHDILSVGYVCRWFEHNLIRLILLLHKYCVHALSTSYRGLDQDSGSFGMELHIPILEYHNSLSHSNSSGRKDDINNTERSSKLMPISQAWLLAAALPQLYSKPQKILPSTNSNKNSSVAQLFKEKHCVMPSHWTLLYDSNDHGLGVNRFLHHILGYKGPTLILLHLENDQTYLIGAPSEWKESTIYNGSLGSCILQVLPKIAILEIKPNILYLNTYTRGYPKGLRAGSDSKKPIISIDEHFESVDIKGIATKLLSIEAWGCGDEALREVQMDIKKWQIKEAERQRTVKLTAADWIDHPDRFLLELGGRQTYNN